MPPRHSAGKGWSKGFNASNKVFFKLAAAWALSFGLNQKKQKFKAVYHFLHYAL
jgi:hypothetical protein